MSTPLTAITGTALLREMQLFPPPFRKKKKKDICLPTIYTKRSCPGKNAAYMYKAANSNQHI